MPKPSNAALLAERKALLEMLEDFEGATIQEKLTAYMEQQKTVVELLAEKNKLLIEAQSSRVTSDSPEYAGDRPEIIKGKPTGPIDYAHYPKPGEVVQQPQYPPNVQPPMTAMEGDMTPAYQRWFLSTNGPEATRAKYGDRIIYLLPDVKGALA